MQARGAAGGSELGDRSGGVIGVGGGKSGVGRNRKDLLEEVIGGITFRRVRRHVAGRRERKLKKLGKGKGEGEEERELCGKWSGFWLYFILFPLFFSS